MKAKIETGLHRCVDQRSLSKIERRAALLQRAVLDLLQPSDKLSYIPLHPKDTDKMQAALSSLFNKEPANYLHVTLKKGLLEVDKPGLKILLEYFAPEIQECHLIISRAFHYTDSEDLMIEMEDSLQTVIWILYIVNEHNIYTQDQSRWWQSMNLIEDTHYSGKVQLSIVKKI